MAWIMCVFVVLRARDAHGSSRLERDPPTSNAPQHEKNHPPALIFEGKHMFFSKIGPKLCVPGPAFCFFIIDISKFLWPRTVI
jgi:hypothetical protein